jgi:hypothetical protein
MTRHDSGRGFALMCHDALDHLYQEPAVQIMVLRTLNYLYKSTDPMLKAPTQGDYTRQVLPLQYNSKSIQINMNKKSIQHRNFTISTSPAFPS